MDARILFAAAQLLVCLRDARLLASRPRLAYWWVPASLLVATVCGVAAEHLSADRARAILEDPRFWCPAVGLHAVAAAWSSIRIRRGGRPDWICVLPTPVTLVAWTGVSREVLVYSEALPGPLTGVLVGAACVGLSMVAAIVTRGRVDAESALRFATLTHLSALCLIPAGAIADRPIASQPVDWTATAVVLPAVGILLGLSFAWHRWRAR